MVSGSHHHEDTQAAARLIRHLTEDASRSALALAAVLSDCGPEAPCHSGACRTCGRLFQHTAAQFSATAIRARAPRGRMTALTIVPGVGCVPPGTLTAKTCAEAADAIQIALSAAGIGPALLGLDVSFNEDLTGEVPPHWSVHAHGACADWLSLVQKRDLRRAFPRTSHVSRPVKTDPLDDRLAWHLYAHEPERERRQTYLDPRERDEREPCRNTRERPLQAAQAVELALVEHRVGLLGRLINCGIPAGAVAEALGAFGGGLGGL